MKTVHITNWPPTWLFYLGLFLLLVAIVMLVVKGWETYGHLSRLLKSADDLQRKVDRDVMPNVNAINANVEQISQQVADMQKNVTATVEDLKAKVEAIRESPASKIGVLAGTAISAARLFRS